MFSVLAILVKPAEIGIIGMAMAWLAFVQLFSEMGFGAALIQRKEVGSRHFSTIFIINIVAGVVLTVLGVILSIPCSLFFKNPAVQPIMAVLSLNFLIGSFSLTQMAIAQKELRFRDLAIRDVMAVLMGGAAGILCALNKFGAWSLVAQSLVTTIMSAFLLWFLSSWRPVLRDYSFRFVKELWPYSSSMFAFSIFKYPVQNLDRIIIGYFLGNNALGYYTFANRIMFQGASSFVGGIGNYMFPKFSIIQEDLASVKSSYLFISKATNTVVTPAAVILAVLARIWVPTVFGEKWIPAVPVIQILSVFAIVCPWISHVGQLMKALNRPKWLLYWSIFLSILVFLFIGIGTVFGIAGATSGLVIAYLFALPVNYWILIKLINVKIKDVLNTLVPSLICSLLLGSGLWLILRSNMSSGHFAIVIWVALAVILYFGALILIDKRFMNSLWGRVIGLRLISR
jgi:PST family polysaccharide transporter